MIFSLKIETFLSFQWRYVNLLSFQLCFAYNGAISKSIKLRFKYQDKKYSIKTGTRTYTFDGSSIRERWNFVCLEIYKLVSEDSWVKYRVSSTPNLKLDYMAVYRDGSGTALVDDVWIGKGDVIGTYKLAVHSIVKHDIQFFLRIRC